jgi:hypothetical protein
MSNISLEETILLAGGFSLNVVAETYAEEKLICRGGKLPSPSFNLNFFLSATQIKKEIWH